MPDLPLPPRGQQSWLDHAARVRASYDLTQRHEGPDFRYWVCTSCGAEREYHPHDVATFRYDVATHTCEVLPPVPAPALPAGAPLEAVLF